MSSKKDLINNGFQLFIGGGLFTGVVILWPILMVFSQVEGDMQEQLLMISDQPGMYMLNFFVASLIAPTMALILVLLAFRVKTRENTLVLNILGSIFIAPYITFVSFAYASQYTILQGFLRVGDLVQAKIWYFENSTSFPYFVNQLGYVFYGLSGLLIGYKFLREKGIPRAIGILLWISGILSFIAFFGLVVGSELLNSTTIISGLLTLPIGILVMILGLRLKRGGLKHG